MEETRERQGVGSSRYLRGSSCNTGMAWHYRLVRICSRSLKSNIELTRRRCLTCYRGNYQSHTKSFKHGLMTQHFQKRLPLLILILEIKWSCLMSWIPIFQESFVWVKSSMASCGYVDLL